MGKKNTTNNESVKSPGKIKVAIAAVRSSAFVFVVGLLCAILTIFLASSFISFFISGASDMSLLESGSAVDLSVTENEIENCTGSVGSRLANFLINDCFGWAAFSIIPFFVILSLKLMNLRSFNVAKWFICSVFALIWGSLFFSFAFSDLMSGSYISPGGWHGENTCFWLISQIGVVGLLLLLATTLLLFLIYLTRETIVWIKKAFSFGLNQVDKIKTLRTEHRVEEPKNKDEEVEGVEDSIPSVTNTSEPETITLSQEDNFTIDMPVDDNRHKSDEIITEIEQLPFTTQENSSSIAQKTVDDSIKENIELNVEKASEEDTSGRMMRPINPRDELSYYKPPTIDLLDKYESSIHSIDMDEQNANKNRIVDVLRNFDIEISSIKATVGPTITLYEITPAPGVRISKIRNLEDDIAMSLSALCIRIIAPIPGKGTIGIEVPNTHKQIVPMSSLLNSRKYKETDMALPIALGKTISNEVYMIDMAKMPHLLVAGATGMGKSVGLNAIITSLLYKMHPAYLKFVMVDPKMVELSLYKVIEKHFLAKLEDADDSIITDVTKVVQTLKSLCVEMDNRYRLLQMASVRSLKEYNEKYLNHELLPTLGHKFIPYIVVVIDEYGDLMMTAGKEIEQPIARIAQKARAVGIHMIIATQRPTTNIITGTIKANFPARMAFRVISVIDSRTILDRAGANQLQGRGDMLFLAGNDPVRVQCALIETKEVERVCDYISKQQGYPTAYYLPEPEDTSDAMGSGMKGEISSDKLDPLFRDAAYTVILHQQGSTSLLQRKFNIGFNRAGRIMDQLCQMGIVGAQDGSKPRQVLCADETDLEMRLKELLK